MGYTGHLIASFKTGLETDVAPWLLPDEAQESLVDGYVQHGVINKRDGYNYFANGTRGDAPYCESRIVKAITGVSMTGAIDSANTVFTTTATSLPIRRGSFVVTGDTPAQTATDDGVGGFTGNVSAGSINYQTGVVSVTFNIAPTGGTITATYDYHPGLPVMMIAQFVTATNTRESIVADQDNLNRYNSITNRYDDITNATYTGGKSDFFSWVQYPDLDDSGRLLFVNNVDPIQSYDGTNVEKFYAVFDCTEVTDEAYGTGDGTATYANTLTNFPVTAGTVVITADKAGTGGGTKTMTDNGLGAFTATSDGTGTINYVTGAVSVTFNATVPNPDPIVADYCYNTGEVTTCLLMFNYKDRLILLRTTETGGTIHPRRIRISGIGQSGNDFRVTATGAGVIDIPDQDWIMGAAYNRDDLMIFTERATWILKYTGNDVVPFTLEKIDGSRGCRAPFSPISYLNLTKAYSPYGFIVTDGYQVKRYDEPIPNYCFEEVNPKEFDLCFSGAVDDDQNHYLIHPSTDAETSDTILVNNYDENNFSNYKIPLSCMGNYLESFDIDWDYLATNVSSWKVFASYYATWNDLSYSKDMPITLGGGHKGEIWRLNINDKEDNPCRVYGVTEISTGPTLVEITSDWNNYALGDIIYFAGLGGSIELNNKQGQITAITDNQTFRISMDSTVPSITAYTSGGVVSRTVPFEFVTKNFNPYTAEGLKVRCGWVYFYMDVSETLLTDKDGNVVPAKIEIEVFSNDSNEPTQVLNVTMPIYTGNFSDYDGRISNKRWFKMYINQTSRFIQFKVKNQQAGSTVRIHAIQPGFVPAGRRI